MKIRYRLYAHTSPESAVDNFDKACQEAEYVPLQEELARAKYVGSEIELNVQFDTETKEISVRMDNFFE